MIKIKRIFSFLPRKVKMWVRVVRARKTVPCWGVCAHCGKPVYHSYPWFTKNPDTHKDAKPLHTKCADIYLFGAELDEA